MIHFILYHVLFYYLGELVYTYKFSFSSFFLCAFNSHSRQVSDVLASNCLRNSQFKYDQVNFSMLQSYIKNFNYHSWIDFSTILFCQVGKNLFILFYSTIFLSTFVIFLVTLSLRFSLFIYLI